MQKRKTEKCLAEVTDQVDRMFRNFHFECLCIHMIYFAIFLYLGIYPMVIFNIFSIVLFAVLTYGKLRKRINHSYFLIHFEILLHASLSVILLGWKFGFEYLIIMLISMVALMPYGNIKGNYIYASIEIFILLLLSVYTGRNDPIYQGAVLDKFAPFMNVIHMLGSFANVLVLALFTNKTRIATRRIMEEEKHELEQLASIDPLTGLFNRRALLERVESFQKSQGSEGMYCIAIGDIDNFKFINDSFGHDAGDFVLKKVSDILRDHFEDHATVCRWGGEEMLIFMPNVPITSVSTKLSNVCEIMNKTNYIYNKNNISFTMTFGVHECNSNQNFNEAVLLADKGLYLGKQNGKNQVVYNM